MTIAVFDYEEGSVDIISVDRAFIYDNYEGHVSRYLTECLNYDLDNIYWMEDVKELKIKDSDYFNQIV